MRFTKTRVRDLQSVALPSEVAQGRSAIKLVRKVTRTKQFPETYCWPSVGQPCLLLCLLSADRSEELDSRGTLGCSLGNAKENGTQAGYILAFTHDFMQRGK